MIYIVDDDDSVVAIPGHGGEQPTSSDCLLLDIQLPGMSGLELQRQLQRTGSRSPVIFITAFDDDKNVNEASKVGAAGYFRKPFDDQALLEGIQRALG